MTESEAISKMRPPNARRQRVWRQGVIQIKVTTACDLDCYGCTAGVGIAKKHKRVWSMTPEQFRQAVESLRGYHGVVGVFGGNPVLSPHFEAYCDIFKQVFPNKDQRGLWSNNLFGKGAICRDTFSPHHSNLNVHRSRKAYDEIKRDWPEAKILERGLFSPSMHASWWTSMADLGVPVAERWELISKCFVNQTWSAEITLVQNELKGFFCEFAATMAEYADLSGLPSLGMDVVPGWWDKPMSEYAEQVQRYCHACGAPLNPTKSEDTTPGREAYTITHAPVFMSIRGKPVTSRALVGADAHPSIHYL